MSQENNYRLLDSAIASIDIDAERAWRFLDSIPEPVPKSLKGRVAEYYSTKALVHDEYNQYSKFHQSNILALKYAVEEENFCIAGQASLDLHTDKYLVAEDTTDSRYLDQAKKYFEKCDDKYLALQIEEMQSYYKSLDGKFEESNAIILDKIDYYKSISNEVGYYYMFANYLLASNYLQLKNLEKAHKYFNELKALKNNPSILPYNQKSFLASLDMYFAETYYEKSIMDSTFHYLQSASRNSKYMAGDVLQDYYKLSASAYKEANDLEKFTIYIDSLVNYEDKLFINNVDASFDINKNLLDAESELHDQKKDKALVIRIVFFLLGLVIVVSLIYLFLYGKHRSKLKTIKKKATDLSYLKSNNEQLAVKIHGLEEYIKNLKKEVRDIASVKCLDHQKLKIKELYTNLHVNSSTILDKGDSHLELINDLNIDFFKKINSLYPELNKSEVIICYYVLMGFSNKEISVFLNTTIRSVESRRYRISKKIDFDKKETTLVEHLRKTFKETLHSAI
ncbi:hypothetical protein EYD45_10700 [Hyunsoonleella flava]|uniref:HTH luxR-type domain-containing protein n=1 Tax=Hyunsoonleella flava TaxID=2527939 RepID=A0A4Q9FCW5_9FLAO|nr:hypothetical protein [Hyunsoonleella flava]TBN03014.1 hypothetical protein EYD45_10700 [Hyunsoonleella flava]